MSTVLINQYVLLLLSKCCMLFCVTTMATANLTATTIKTAEQATAIDCIYSGSDTSDLLAF